LKKKMGRRRRKKNKLTSSSRRSGEPFGMTEKLQNENIEILKEELDFAARHVERCQDALERAIELATAAKRDLDRAMEEKRRFTRIKLHVH
jgi:hypothetical protein